MLDLGTVRPGSTLYIPFNTFDSNDPSASVTLTGLATTDIEVYKDGGTTQRASDAGFALLDTDGIDFDGITGIHGISINLADNTTAGFWAAGSQYWVIISSVTIDAATVNFIAATFRIGYESAILNTTIASLSSQTSFTLTVGPAEDDALNGMWCVIHDVASAVQLGKALILDYTGSTKTVTLAAGTTFTAAATDNFAVIDLAPLQPTTTGRTLDVSTGGEAGLDWANIGSPTTANNLSGTNIDTDQVVASVTGAVGSVTGAVGSVTGNVGGNVTGSIGSVAADGITASSIAADAIGASELAADAITEIQSGLATAAALTTVDDFLDTEIAAIKAKTDLIPAAPAAVGDIPTAAAVADAVWDEDATGHQTQGTFGQAIGDPVADTNTIYKAVVTDATGATVGVDGAAILADTNELQTDWVNGGRLDLILDARASQTSVDTIDGIVDSILVDTAEIGAAGAGLTALATQASVNTIDDFLDTEVAAILADTNELQTDLANGGRLDLLIDAIKAQTDLLPSDPADASVVAGLISGLDAKLDTIDNFLDTEIAGLITSITGIVPISGTIGATGNSTTALHLDGLAYADDGPNSMLLTIKDVSTGLFYSRWIADFATTGDIATVATLPFTPEASVDLYWITPVRADVSASVAAADIRAAVGLASANLDTQLSTIDTVVDSILVDTAEIGAAGAGLTALATQASVNTIDDFLDTEIAAILADTNELQTDWANGGRLDLLLDGAASAGDPWTTALPGAYGAGTAGKIVGDNINATISSRASQTSVDTIDDFLDTEIAAILADTNELQTDWVNGGRLDLILDARASQTSVDDLPTNAELATSQASADDATLAAIAALNNLSAAQVNAEVDTALADINLDHLVKSAVDTDWATTVHLNSVLGHVADNGTSATFDRTTDSLEALQAEHDATQTKIDTVDDLLDTEIGTLTTELAKVPKSDSNVTWNATAAAQLQSEATDALNAYDPPTRAELTTDTNSVLTAVGDVPTNAELATALGTADDATLAAIAALSIPTAAAVADAVWDEDATAHQTQGTFGQAIGDPVADSDTIWALVNTNLNATVSSRASQTSVDDLPTNAELATALGTADDAVLTAIDALPTNAELATALGTADDAVLAAIAALNNLSQADIRTALGMATANLDTQLGDLPTNAELAAGFASGDDAVLAAVAALNNLSSAQAQTAAAAALTAYDPPTRTEATADKDEVIVQINANETKIDTLDTVADAIKAKTDSLTFTVAGQVDGNIQYVNDVAVTGTGASGDEWGP